MNNEYKYVFNNIINCVLPKLKNKNTKNLLKNNYISSIIDLYFLYFDLRNIIIINLPKNNKIKKLGFHVKKLKSKHTIVYIIGNPKMNINKFEKISKNYKKIYGKNIINHKIGKNTAIELGYFHTNIIKLNSNNNEIKSLLFLFTFNKKIITNNIFGPQSIHKKISMFDKKNITKKTKYMNLLLSKINPKFKIKYIIK